MKTLRTKVSLAQNEEAQNEEAREINDQKVVKLSLETITCDISR
jgi:hypothetical protein